MADAGVSYAVGRESAATYGESLAGAAPGTTVFTAPAGIDPGFPVAAPGAVGSGDNRIQYSNFRLCFSTKSDRQVHPSRGYDASQFDIVAAYIDWRRRPRPTPDITWFLGRSR